jgi:hypothetical protein
MRLRFRLGPFTFGKGGTRLSLWKSGAGVSVPLSKKKGGTFGKVSLGPVSAYFGSSSKKKIINQTSYNIGTDVEVAIQALASDQKLINNLQNKGVPWRGVQECLKEALPEQLEDRNEVAYKLVPKAMDIVFGEQNSAWKTEKRTSKSGQGQTTWIVLI